MAPDTGRQLFTIPTVIAHEIPFAGEFDMSGFSLALFAIGLCDSKHGHGIYSFGMTGSWYFVSTIIQIYVSCDISL